MKYQILTVIDGKFEEFKAEANNELHAKNIAYKALRNRLAKLTTPPKEYGLSYNAKVKTKGE